MDGTLPVVRTMKVLVTGGAGLVGSESARVFSEAGHSVTTVDNYLRGKIFGNEGDTRRNLEKVKAKLSIEHHEMDIREDRMVELIKGKDVIVHTAAQPSHPRSIEIPMEDFEINALGTLKLLEAARKHADKAVFVFTSTNKVYGEVPNFYAYEKRGKRYVPVDPELQDGFDESLRTDQCLHTPFGVSKVAADYYVQEYARLYGMRTGIFRMCCITGGAAQAVEMHNWEPFFVRKAMLDQELTIYGHEGYQVRDIIHARDLSKLFLEFVKAPRSGEVYNIGGGMKNSLSLLEAIDLIEKLVGHKMRYKFGPAREGDHIWYVTNIGKARRHYPTWDIRIGLDEIFGEIHQALKDSLKA
jgi:CDP-paratose 2-epimerase